MLSYVQIACLTWSGGFQLRWTTYEGYRIHYQWEGFHTFNEIQQCRSKQVAKCIYGLLVDLIHFCAPQSRYYLIKIVLRLKKCPLSMDAHDDALCMRIYLFAMYVSAYLIGLIYLWIAPWHCSTSIRAVGAVCPQVILPMGWRCFLLKCLIVTNIRSRNRSNTLFCSELN